jgi:hypothetical protein
MYKTKAYSQDDVITALYFFYSKVKDEIKDNEPNEPNESNEPIIEEVD